MLIYCSQRWNKDFILKSTSYIAYISHVFRISKKKTEVESNEESFGICARNAMDGRQQEKKSSDEVNLNTVIIASLKLAYILVRMKDMHRAH